MSVRLGATGVLALAGIGLAGVVAWKLYSTGRDLANGAGEVLDAAGDVLTHELNPASADNVVNQGVTAIGQSITGKADWTLGGAIFDATHADPTDPTRNTIGDSIANAITAPGRALGGWLYDLTH